MFKPLDIIDLSVLSEKILSQHGQADMLEILLKYGQEPSIVVQLKENPTSLEKLMERVYGKSGANYILGVEKTENVSEVLDIPCKFGLQQRERNYECSTTTKTARYSTRYAAGYIYSS